MVDLEQLECEICNSPLDACTCPDIDERIYALTESERVVHKCTRSSEHEERMDLSMARQHFRVAQEFKKEVEVEKKPWEGLRDRFFGSGRG